MKLCRIWLPVLAVCILLLTQCGRRNLVMIQGRVGSVGYISFAKGRSDIEYHSIEIQSDDKTYDCRFPPAAAQSVLGEPLSHRLLVSDPDHATNQLILTDEPLKDKTIVATLADLQPVGQK